MQIDAASKSAIDRRSYPSVDVRALHRAFVLNPVMEMPERAAVGITLLLAGVYQLTPWKAMCLRQCRSPLAFIMQR